MWQRARGAALESHPAPISRFCLLQEAGQPVHSSRLQERLQPLKAIPEMLLSRLKPLLRGDGWFH
ncbi:hypothetical protein SB85_01970 [Xanthomonas sacchari]|nr:hypothetical protein SB85_01970 [Xanthomonas sacchari]KAB7766537.1 hypothetical protein CEK68_09865 [Xanthomonas sp. LMG 12461]